MQLKDLLVTTITLKEPPNLVKRSQYWWTGHKNEPFMYTDLEVNFCFLDRKSFKVNKNVPF